MSDSSTGTRQQQTRQRLIEASATLCKSHGFEATGVDALARAAGLTSGAFYRSFPSKAALLPELLALELQRSRDGLAQAVAGGHDALQAKFNAYLSQDHVEAPGQGCVIPALGAEVGRADEAARQVYEQGVLSVIQTLSPALGDDQKAWTTLCLAAGAVMVARGLHSAEHQAELLASVRQALFTHLYPPATPT